MKIIKTSDVKVDESLAPIFTGGRVFRQQLLGFDITSAVRVGLVRFDPRARNVFHSHTFGQVLYVVEGKGIVATEDQEHVVTPGTIIFIPPGQRHWHGATEDSSFAHLTIATPGETTLHST